MTNSKNPYRLDRTVVPSAYRIFLRPDLEASTFAGHIEIDVDVTSPVDHVTMHAKALKLGAATITTSTTTLISSAPTHDDTYETVTFGFDSALPEGLATIEIDFTGILNDQLAGFYRSTFTDADGVTHAIATTQFEHSDARQAFPCWDEPSFKATYQINMTVPTHLAVYSNSPETSNVDLGNGLRDVSFSPTMKMSTYLVAFIVGPFEATDPVDVDGVPLRIIYPIGKGHLTGLALETGIHSLRFFSNYFDIPYPGDKLDMVAIPDFANGAMENLGLVTYRETALLVDEESSGIVAAQRVAEVVMHEIAHMWFGDLVTMEWWEGIWLNEAFATFCAALAMDSFRPEWDVWKSFTVVDREFAMQVDGLHSTRPIEYEVISPDDTQGMFDVLTYEKGGSVLRMLQQYLGEDTYRDGIRRYLKKHSYANTITTDLWDALEEESGEPVRDIMNSFILQGGHPMITFADGQLSQQPFQYGPAKGASSIGKEWLVPILTRSLDGGPSSRQLLGAAPLAITDAPPVLVNAGASGVFRTRYGANEAAVIAQRFSDLSEIERANVILDAWAALFAGQISWDTFETLARNAAAFQEIGTLETIASAFDSVYRALTDQQRPKIAALAREFFAPALDSLTWDELPGDDTFAGKLRGVCISVLGTIARDEAVIGEALRRFDSGVLNGDQALSIMRIAAEANRPGTFDELWKRSQEAATPQDEERYRLALGFILDETEVLRAAEMCFSTFRSQDGGLMLGFFERNRVAGPAVWKYATSRWDDALKQFPHNMHVRVAGGISTFITDEDFAHQVEQFHAAHELAGRQKTIDQGIERMWVGVAFTKAIRSQF